MNSLLKAAAIGLLAGTLTFAAQANARTHGRAVSVQGVFGHGYERSRRITRDPGYRSATRSFQTNSGRGINSNRNASWSNGSYSGGATHTTNNGTTWGRSTSVEHNADGSYTGTMTRTRPNGSTGTVSRTGTPH